VTTCCACSRSRRSRCRQESARRSADRKPERGVFPPSTQRREHSDPHLSHRVSRADQGPDDGAVAVRARWEGLTLAEGDLLAPAVGPVDARLWRSMSSASLSHDVAPLIEGRGSLVTFAEAGSHGSFFLPLYYARESSEYARMVAEIHPRTYSRRYL